MLYVKFQPKTRRAGLSAKLLTFDFCKDAATFDFCKDTQNKTNAKYNEV